MESAPSPNKNKSRLAWTPQEDQCLRELKQSRNDATWDTIAILLHQKLNKKQRSAKQCRDRFINYAQFYSQDGKISDWSVSEIALIFQNYLQLGAKWALISQLFSERSANSVKNKFYGSLRKLSRMIKNDMKSKGHKCSKTLNQKSLIYILTFKNKTGELDEEAQTLQQLILQRLSAPNQSDPQICYSHIGLKIRKFNDRKRFHAVNKGIKISKIQESAYQTNQFEADIEKIDSHKKFEQQQFVPQRKLNFSKISKVQKTSGVKERGVHQLDFMTQNHEEMLIVRPQCLEDFDKEVQQIYNVQFKHHDDIHYWE